MLTVHPPQFISKRDNSYCGSSYLLICLLGLAWFCTVHNDKQEAQWNCFLFAVKLYLKADRDYLAHKVFSAIYSSATALFSPPPMKKMHQTGFSRIKHCIRKSTPWQVLYFVHSQVCECTLRSARCKLCHQKVYAMLCADIRVPFQQPVRYKGSKKHLLEVCHYPHL